MKPIYGGGNAAHLFDLTNLQTESTKLSQRSAGSFFGEDFSLFILAAFQQEAHNHNTIAGTWWDLPQKKKASYRLHLTDLPQSINPPSQKTVSLLSQQLIGNS